jgi:hypothetical protein
MEWKRKKPRNARKDKEMNRTIPVYLLFILLIVSSVQLVFADEPWEFSTVEKHAVFTGMIVSVDGQECAKERFCSQDAVLHAALGCKIEVRERKSLNKWHGEFRGGYYSNDVLVNFHG